MTNYHPIKYHRNTAGDETWVDIILKQHYRMATSWNERLNEILETGNRWTGPLLYLFRYITALTLGSFCMFIVPDDGKTVLFPF